MRTRWFAPLVALAIVPLSTTPANAQTPPPPAWTCAAVVTGVRVPHEPLGVVRTAEVDTVQAVVTCELTGLLTTAPANYLPLYSGTMTIGVLVNGSFVGCGSTGSEANGIAVPSVGPTLVMAAVAVCPVFPVNENAVHEPIAYWSTHDLTCFSCNYTVHGQTGPWLAL